MAEVANVVAGMCDELVAVLQKYSASLKSGNFANGNINPPALGAKRKRTTNADPNKPKKAVSAYIFYMMEQQPIVKKDNPDINQTEVMTRLGKGWTELATEKKEVYVKMAESAKIEKSKEMAEYTNKSSSSSSVPVQSPAAKVSAPVIAAVSRGMAAIPVAITAPTVISASTPSAFEKAEKKKNRKPKKSEGDEVVEAVEAVKVEVPETVEVTAKPDSAPPESEKKKVLVLYH
jgi:hypothetical protein